MRMDSGICFVVLGLLVYVRIGTTLSHTDALTGSASVWVKDVTARSYTDKRIFDDPVLPHHLTFHIRQGSFSLTLNLKRNFEIDPNADIYVVQMSKDGLSIPTKTTTLEREAVAYYQDMDHGAYITVKCVKNINEQCERVISGNLQIGDRIYHLIPAATSDRPEHFRKVSIIGKRYLLLDQTHIQEENLFENKDTSIVHNRKAQDEIKLLSRMFTGQKNEKCSENEYFILPNQNLADLKEKRTPDETRQLKQNYYVKIAVLIDSRVWDYYYLKDAYDHTVYKIENVKRKIREAYSHIMNGVNLRYKSITDPSISISIILTDFIFFLHEGLFPHMHSKVSMVNGRTFIESNSYIDDLTYWDVTAGSGHLRKYDHAMLFTRHLLYKGTNMTCLTNGMSPFGTICDRGTSISLIEARDYVRTVGTAAHELGHNLGAYHDGHLDAVACKSEDYFIMSAKEPRHNLNGSHIINMWKFSNCSVESFKKTLQNKHCVQFTGLPYDSNEYQFFMNNQPGSIFTPQEHCYLLYGQEFVPYPIPLEKICYILGCHNPRTGQEIFIYLYAARGTPCGENKVYPSACHTQTYMQSDKFYKF